MPNMEWFQRWQKLRICLLEDTCSYRWCAICKDKPMRRFWHAPERMNLSASSRLESAFWARVTDLIHHRMLNMRLMGRTSFAALVSNLGLADRPVDDTITLHRAVELATRREGMC